MWYAIQVDKHAVISPYKYQTHEKPTNINKQMENKKKNTSQMDFKWTYKAIEWEVNNDTFVIGKYTEIETYYLSVALEIRYF